MSNRHPDLKKMFVKLDTVPTTQTPKTSQTFAARLAKKNHPAHLPADWNMTFFTSSKPQQKWLQAGPGCSEKKGGGKA